MAEASQDIPGVATLTQDFDDRNRLTIQADWLDEPVAPRVGFFACGDCEERWGSLTGSLKRPSRSGRFLRGSHPHAVRVGRLRAGAVPLAVLFECLLGRVRELEADAIVRFRLQPWHLEH